MKAIVSARSGSTAERQLRSPHYSAAALPFMIGERSRRQSATILGKIRALPCKTVHAVDFESVARPGEPAVLSVDSFVLERSEERRGGKGLESGLAARES